MAGILAEPGLAGDAVETNGHAPAGPEALPNGHDAAGDPGVLVLPDDLGGAEAAAPPAAMDGAVPAGAASPDQGFEWVPEAAPAAAPARLIRPVAAPRLPGLIWPIAGVAILVVTVVLAVGMFFAHQWLSGLLILLIGGLTGTHLGGVRNPGQLFGGLLMAVAFGIALGVEYVYLADHLAGGAAFRMNTVFKFYEQVWILVACGSAIALYAIIGPRGRAGTAGDAAFALAGETELASEATPDTAALPVDGVTVPDAHVVAALGDPNIETGGAVPRPPPTPEPDVPPQPPDEEPGVEPMEIPAFPGTGAPPIITVPGRTGDPLTPPEPEPMGPPTGIPGDPEPEGQAPDGATAEAAAAADPRAPEPVLAATEVDPVPVVTMPVRARRVRLGEDSTAATQEPPEAITPVAAGPVRPASRGPRSWWTLPRAIWLVPFAILVLGSFIFTVAGTQARVADRFPGARPDVGTLNGMDWMNVTILTLGFDNNKVSGPINYRYEREALDWMNTHINGTPVIAAAPREYYRESGMMPSTYTGLPMVVGGLHQDEQRYGWEVSERRDDMNNFYRDPDVQQTLLLINKYDIEYIYVGQIETIGYQDAPAGIAKFKDMVGPYLDVAYQNDLVTIYRVRSAEVAANVGSAPGAAPAPKPTPKPAPPAPDLSNDPVLKGLLTTVQNAPSNVDGRRALAEYYRSHNAIDKAIEQYQAVVQLAPQDVAAHHILGDLYTQQGEPDKALAIWEAAVQDAGPNDKPAAYNKVGMAYQERQRFDDAINAFKAAVAANPSFVEAWYHMGETYQTMQNIDAARQAFQSTIKNAPADDSGQHWAQQAQQALDALP